MRVVRAKVRSASRKGTSLPEEVPRVRAHVLRYRYSRFDLFLADGEKGKRKVTRDRVTSWLTRPDVALCLSVFAQ